MLPLSPTSLLQLMEICYFLEGRLGWKQYIPKRSRFAIKTVELCDNKTGYLWNFIVYTGKSADQVVSDLLSFSRVVMDLLMGLLGKGYCLVTDNYNTCHVLYKKLLEQKTDAYGTVRLGRNGMPLL